MKTSSTKRTRRHVVIRLSPGEAAAIKFIRPNAGTPSPKLTRGERRAVNSLESKLREAELLAPVDPPPMDGPTRFQAARTLRDAEPPRGGTIRKGDSI